MKIQIGVNYFRIGSSGKLFCSNREFLDQVNDSPLLKGDRPPWVLVVMSYQQQELLMPK